MKGLFFDSTSRISTKNSNQDQNYERLAGAAIPELAVTLLTAGVSAAGNAARRSGAAANLLESMQDFGSMASRTLGNESGSTPIFGDIAKKVLGRTIASASSGNIKELLPVSSLNKRQRAIHDALTEQGAVDQFYKKSVSMNDLRAISQVTGDEYNMFTLGSRRTIIRGYGNEVSVSPQMYDDLIAGNYGKWSGHTHPPGYSINPGPADRPFLQQMGQQRSAIRGDNGHYTFGQLPSDDAMIQSEIMRKQWERIYGN